MMPNDEIEVSKHYKDKNGIKVNIDAGKNGWTVIYADGSSNYKDETLSTEENFRNAIECAEENLGSLTETDCRKQTSKEH